MHPIIQSACISRLDNLIDVYSTLYGIVMHSDITQLVHMHMYMSVITFVYTHHYVRILT